MVNEVVKKLQERVDELRKRYKNEPHIETLYRFREAQRSLEMATLILHRSESAARQSEGESASSTLPH